MRTAQAQSFLAHWKVFQSCFKLLTFFPQVSPEKPLICLSRESDSDSDIQLVSSKKAKESKKTHTLCSFHMISFPKFSPVPNKIKVKATCGVLENAILGASLEGN